jgi:hypothetical protein
VAQSRAISFSARCRNISSEFSDHFAVINHAQLAPDIGIDVEAVEFDGTIAL